VRDKNEEIFVKRIVSKIEESSEQNLNTKVKNSFNKSYWQNWSAGLVSKTRFPLVLRYWDDRTWKTLVFVLSSLLPEHWYILVVIATSAWSWLKQSMKNQHLRMKNRDIKKEANVPKQFLCFPIVTCTYANSIFLIRRCVSPVVFLNYMVR